ncbi:Serine/threonine-protein kinase ATM-like [Melia azedarach]|uniref:Serine/threonine-protein kinase ATM-like n=1 Tax=Melia azedarach TaxID=155640 RepID=A0ACC1XNM4_MELAZ|nr:Serine/threonine-protein kinase ATM-like [Melia azedarach]
MENPKTPETLETQNTTDKTLEEAPGSSGLFVLSEKCTGLASAEENGKGIDMNSDDTVACDVEFTKTGDNIGGKTLVVDMDAVFGVDENSVSDFEVEKGCLLSDGTDKKNVYKVDPVKAPFDSDVVGLGNDGNEEVATEKQIVQDEERKEEIVLGLNAAGSGKRIGVSGDNISLYVDFSGSLTRVNVDNLNGASGVGLMLSQELKGAGLVESVSDNQECKFSVGDVVWVKTKNQTWWPGRIYNPLDAPESAVKSDLADCVLVGYFGSGHVAWCHPSQLKPFYENFELMSGRNKARIFIVAVEKAVDEFGKRLKSEMTCSCFAKESHQLGDNGGNSEEISISDHRCGELGKFFVTNFEPAKCLQELKSLALGSPMPALLEFTVSQSCLSAFYLSAGHCQVPMHQLQDITDDVESGDKDLGRAEENLKTVTNEKVLQLKKKEALAMILGGDLGVVPENGKGNVVEGIASDKMPSNFRKRKRKKDLLARDGNDKVESIDASALASLATCKEDTLLGSPTTAEFSGVQNVDDQSEVKSDKGFELRERKKSKYLSYPYVNWERGLPSEAEDLKALKVTNEEGEDTGGGQFVVSPSVVRGCGKRFQKTWFRKFISESDISANPELINASPAELLLELSSTAVDCFYPNRTKNFDLIEWFFSRFRISAYHDESIYEMYCKNVVGPKQKDAKPVMNEYPDTIIGKDPQEMNQPFPNIDSQQKRKKRKKNANSVRSKIKSLSGLSDVNINVDTSNLSGEDLQSTGTLALDSRSEEKGEKEGVTPLSAQIEQTTSIPDLNGNGAMPMSSAENPQVIGHVSSETKKRKRKRGAAHECSEIEVSAGLQYTNGSSSKPGSLVVDLQVTGPYSINSIPGQNNGNSPVPALWVKDPPEVGLLSAEGKPGKKRRRRKVKAASKNTETMSMASIPDLNGTSAEPSAVPPVKAERKRRRKREASAGRRSNTSTSRMLDIINCDRGNTNGESLGTTLILTFGPGVSIPSKEVLVGALCRFGPLKESETHLSRDSCTAQVVFMRSMDAEEAVKSLEKSNPFGPPLVSYKIRPVEAFRTSAKAAESVPQPGEAPPLDFIKQNLEMMTSMLENSGDNLSPEMKAKLESEIKGLLKR